MSPAQQSWMQLTAGTGPEECAWAVVRVMEAILEEAAARGLAAEAVELLPGSETGTARSVTLSISGSGCREFLDSWRGTVQWVGRSPFRPAHKRKNWFVGVDVFEAVAETVFDAREVRWETMRASGPGGQHVNRTESAVRVTHLPTGLQAAASEERSQHRNRRLALARLAARLADAEAAKRDESRRNRWRAHHELERGNPVRVLSERNGVC